MVVVLPFLVAWWRTRYGLHFQWIDVALAFAVAPQFLAFWPSPVDWKISLRSWPYLPIVGAGDKATFANAAGVTPDGEAANR